MRPEGLREGDIPGVQARRRRLVPGPPETVWRWLREPARLAAWLGAEVDEVEGRLCLVGEGCRGPYRDEIETVEEVAPRRLVAHLRRLQPAWPEATRLEIELTPTAEGGTEVSILHDGFQQLPLSECLTHWEEQRRRWERGLARLADLLDAGH